MIKEKEFEEACMKHCIYCVTNKINGKKYIGQTKDFKHRKSQHCGESTDKFYIDRAINKYGKENFKFEIIHKNISIEKINQWETYYINEIYNTFKGKGYNCQIGGGVNFGFKHTKKAKRKMRKNHADFSGENHPRSKLNKAEGEKIYKEYKTTDITLQELTKKYPVDKSIIWKITKAKHWTTKNKKPITCKRNKTGHNSHYDLKSEGGTRKLTDEQATDIFKNYYKSDITQEELATKYNVTQSLISMIVNQKYGATKNLQKNCLIK